MDDPDDDSLVEDLVNQPELAPTRRISPFESITEWLADAIRNLREWTSDEFPTCDGHYLG